MTTPRHPQPPAPLDALIRALAQACVADYLRERAARQHDPREDRSKRDGLQPARRSA